MKKIILIGLYFMMTQVVIAQIEHGLKLGANFATIKTNISYGSKISSLLCPSISYILRSSGDNWGYFLEMGYSQSGFKETMNNNSTVSTLKVSNLDFIPIGIQYAFLSDWAKIRPVLQASLGLRISISAKLTSANESQDIELDKMLDIPWSVGGGIQLGKHAAFIISYGGGFLKAVSSKSDWKNRQLQISASYFF